MEESSNNNFEQQWKQRFEKASTPPPPDMWMRIEVGLEEKSDNKPLFLVWGVPGYLISGIAASLILAIGGWLLLTNSEKSSPETLVSNSTISRENQQIKQEQLTQPRDGEGLIANSTPTEGTANVFSRRASKPASLQAKSLPVGQHSSSTIKAKTAPEINLSKASSEVVSVSSTAVESARVVKQLTDILDKLKGLEYDEYAVRYILKRNKLAYIEPKEEAEPTKVNRQTWIGLVSGLSPFKPNFQSNNLNQLAAANVSSYSSNNNNFTTQKVTSGVAEPASENSFAIPTGSPVQQFTNGRAFNLGIQAGKQLTKRLALESGVRYIQGSSPINTNVYTINERTGEVNTFVQDFIAENKSLSNAVVAPQETLSNSYEYLSVPLQLAYGIPLLTKLNVELTGGVSADMFLQNTLQSETTNVASLKPSNSAFRTVGVSGLGGIRLNYSFDRNWEITVGSAFQQALVSNFESGTAAKIRPQMLGVNYGINYHF